MRQKLQQTLLATIGEAYQSLILLGLIVTLGAWGVLFWVVPPPYEATAQVLLSDALYTLQFDDRLETERFDSGLIERGDVIYSVLPNLVLADEVLATVLDQAEWQTTARPTLNRFRQDATAFVYNRRSSLLALQVQATDAETAAELANLWAAVSVQRLNDLFGPNTPQVGAMQTELNAWLERQKRANIAVADYESRNDQQLRERDITVLTDDYIGLRYRQVDLDDFRLNLNIFAGLVANQPADQVISSADLITLIGLQARILQINSEALQLEISPTPTMTYAELRQRFDDLLAGLDVIEDSTAALLDGIEQDVTTNQVELAALYAASYQVYQEQTLSRETSQLLTQKLAEVQVDTALNNTPFRVATRGVPPQKPTGRLLRVLVGVAAGGAAVLLATSGLWLRRFLGG